MDDLVFGLETAAVGMGVVFALLIGLMLVLMVLRALDRQPAPTPPAVREEPEPEAEPLDELDDPDLVAAILVAVLTHQQVRRGQAAPLARRYRPGSHLYANRWTASGRAQQTTPWRGR